MLSKKTKVCFLVIPYCLLAQSALFGLHKEHLQMEEQEFKQDMRHIASLEKSFGKSVELDEVEKLADKIQTDWFQKDKKYYAKLMLEICKPLSSGRFKNDRQYTLARKYALLALREPNTIPLETELELIGHVTTNMLPPRAPEGQVWLQQRKRDVEVRFHAWKRLIEAIDPNWDPNDVPLVNVSPPLATGLPAGAAMWITLQMSTLR